MLTKILSLVSNSNPSFIGIYDNVLSQKECETLIDYLEKSEEKIYGIENDAKKVGITKSYDFNNPDDYDVNKIVNKSIEKSFPKYKSNYSWLAMGGEWWSVDRYYNLQKFEEGGGFFTPHCENGIETPQRMLVWMVYLNNAISGTEFIYYNRIVKPKLGRMVIWPAGWTHTHKGVVPNKGNKYMATGWCEYRKE